MKQQFVKLCMLVCLIYCCTYTNNKYIELDRVDERKQILNTFNSFTKHVRNQEYDKAIRYLDSTTISSLKIDYLMLKNFDLESKDKISELACESLKSLKVKRPKTKPFDLSFDDFVNFHFSNLDLLENYLPLYMKEITFLDLNRATTSLLYRDEDSYLTFLKENNTWKLKNIYEHPFRKGLRTCNLKIPTKYISGNKLFLSSGEKISKNIYAIDRDLFESDKYDIVVLPRFKDFENVHKLLPLSDLKAISIIGRINSKKSYSDTYLSTLKSMKNLEFLSIKSEYRFTIEQFNQLLEIVYSLKNLKFLLIDFQYLDIKVNFENFKNLTALQVRNIKQDVSDSIYELSDLTSLSIATDSIVSISPKISNLSNLEHLSILKHDESNLELPINFNQLTKLKRLDVVANSILLYKFIPAFKNLKQLTVKNFDFKLLSADLKYLEYLNILSPKRLDGIDKFRSLKYLNIHSTNLEKFSYSHRMGNLNKLKILKIYDNKLKTVPKFIKYLNELEYLKLTGSQIVDYNFDCSNMNKIEIVHFHTKDILNIPFEFCGSGVVILDEIMGLSFNSYNSHWNRRWKDSKKNLQNDFISICSENQELISINQSELYNSIMRSSMQKNTDLFLSIQI